MNAAGFGLMGWDKRQAMNGGWRIPEKRLFLTAIIGGSVGILAGMRLFRHKTQHWTFTLGIPIIIAIQLFLLGYKWA